MSGGDYIPLELQIEIIKRLPVKSVIKFRSVSKTWKSTIHSSNFISNYRSFTHYHLLQRYSYACIIEDDDTSFPRHKTLPLPSASDHRDIIMVGCSQGLCAFASYDTAVAVIWNPSIRKSVDIPIPNLSQRFYATEFGFGVCNATDPIIVKIDFTVDDYGQAEIIRILSQVEVFRLSTGDWRILSNTNTKSLPPKSCYCTESSCVATDRFIYWIIVYWASDDYDYLNNLILSFDTTSEDFTEIHLPCSLADHGDSFLNLSKLKESLIVIHSELRAQDHEYDVWIMTAQTSFVKLYTIRPPNVSILRVIGFRKNGQPIIYFSNGFDKEQDSVFVYEPDSQHFTDTGISPNGYPRFASSYTRTLLLLNH